jgi:polyisoprenoid-binding protein YceI
MYWRKIFFAVFALVAAAAAQQPIDVAHSTLTVRVYKSGLFSGFAHDHEVRAPITAGTVDEAKSTVELRVQADKLEVVDPEASPKTRAEIQQTMLGPQVLDTVHFPEIAFRSTTVERLGAGQWRVHGELTLHGQTHPVDVEVTLAGGHYRGTARLKQRDFGMAPISIMGGTVKVKDEVRVEFDIVAMPR